MIKLKNRKTQGHPTNQTQSQDMGSLTPESAFPTIRLAYLWTLTSIAPRISFNDLLYFYSSKALSRYLWLQRNDTVSIPNTYANLQPWIFTEACPLECLSLPFQVLPTLQELSIPSSKQLEDKFSCNNTKTFSY